LIATVLEEELQEVSKLSADKTVKVQTTVLQDF